MYKDYLYNYKNRIAQISLFAFLFTTSALSGDYSNQNSSYNPANIRSDPSKVPISDQNLQEKIQDRITSGWFIKRYNNVTVEVNEGKVALSGYVDSPKDQEKLVTEIQRFDDVKSVSSNLKFNNP